MQDGECGSEMVKNINLNPPWNIYIIFRCSLCEEHNMNA